ncbi:MAG: LPS-assembly protein LptD [Desulfobacula sp.]|nr:LPS-assembly protein LptD [Desulfobacula sp.]
MSNLLNQKFLRFFVIFTFFYISIFPNMFGMNAVANNALEDPKEIPWHITAKKVTFDQKRNVYIAQDNVVITGGKTRLEADYIEFSNKTKDAVAQGNVILISGQDSITCNAMTLNLSTKTGIIDKGTIFIEENHFYLTGENIKKTGESTYSAQKGSITSCTGESPDWKITGDNIKVTIDGFGSATNPVLWARKLPVMYSPYLLFPAKTKRQTGLLFPRATSSDRKGLEFEQPLFIAISRNSDATIYADYMSDRGIKLSSDFRYILDNKTEGAIYFDVLKDEKKDDGTDETEKYSFDSTPQRTNSDRFWFRMKHNQNLPLGFTAKLDIDVVSDEDYLLEFKDGFTGYTQTKKYFEKAFGRSLDEYDDYTRKNWLNINKSWSNYYFNVEVLWYDNIRARRQDTDDTTLQTLPAVEFNTSKQQIGHSKLYYSLDSEYRSFYRQETTDTLVTGQRADIYPKIYLPLKLGKSFNFEPYVGVRETIWYTNDFTDSDGDSDSLRTRQMYDIGAELSTKINRVFNLNNNFADKIKHEIIPKLEYGFTPNIDQDDLPSFDGLDSIAQNNMITWSLINNFTSRKSSISPKGEETLSYNNFAWIKLYQTWDIRKERDNESRPFSDLSLETILKPSSFFSLDMNLAWSPYDNYFNTFNLGNTLQDNRGDSLTTEYRYSRDSSESLYSRLNIFLTDELSGYCSVENNLREKKSVETQAGFTLEKSCWTLNLYVSKSPDEQSISFLINLHGLGEFGTK